MVWGPWARSLPIIAKAKKKKSSITDHRSKAASSGATRWRQQTRQLQSGAASQRGSRGALTEPWRSSARQAQHSRSTRCGRVAQLPRRAATALEPIAPSLPPSLHAAPADGCRSRSHPTSKLSTWLHKLHSDAQWTTMSSTGCPPPRTAKQICRSCQKSPYDGIRMLHRTIFAWRTWRCTCA